jgi:hypothetical protein
MTRKQIKTSYRSDDPTLQPVCDSLNEMGEWKNAHGSLRPIVTKATQKGCVHVWDPWESPFVHPWRVSLQAGLAKVDVAGGRVNRGDALATVTGLTGLTAVDGLKVWLRVKHYHDYATASESILEHGTGAYPTSSNTATLSTIYLPVAEIDGTTLKQYLYEDQYVPRMDPPPPDMTHVFYVAFVAGVKKCLQSGVCGS